MKVIFLDVDGVLNSQSWFKKHHHDKGLSLEEWRINQIDPKAAKLVKEIVDKTGAKIVLSSSWRGHKAVNSALFKGFGLEIMDETPRGIRVTYGEETLYTFRGLEIYYYLDHHPEIKEYVIIDDDTDMLYYQREHFIHTFSSEGIKPEHVAEAINILNKHDQH